MRHYLHTSIRHNAAYRKTKHKKRELPGVTFMTSGSSRLIIINSFKRSCTNQILTAEEERDNASSVWSLRDHEIPVRNI